MPARQRVGDPDDVQRAQAAQRDDAHARVVLHAVQARHVQRRVGVVLAHEHEHARLLLVLLGHLDGLDHRGDDVHRVVLERDDALGAGAHADAAPAAAVRVRLGRALLVLVERAERALLRAALALRAALQEEARGTTCRPPAGARPGPRAASSTHWMAFRAAPAASSWACAASIGRAHGAGRVDAGAPGLVREADEVRVGEAVLEGRQVRSLAVGQVQDLGAFVVSEFLDLLLGLGPLGLGLGPRAVSPWRPRARGWPRRRPSWGPCPVASTTRSTCDLDRSRRAACPSTVTASLPPGGLSDRRSPRPWSGSSADGPGPRVEPLVLPRRAHVLVDDEDLGVGVLLVDVVGMLQRRHAAHRGAVGQVVLVARARALDEQHALDRLAVRGPR